MVPQREHGVEVTTSFELDVMCRSVVQKVGVAAWLQALQGAQKPLFVCPDTIFGRHSCTDERAFEQSLPKPADPFRKEFFGAAFVPQPQHGVPPCRRDLRRSFSPAAPSMLRALTALAPRGAISKTAIAARSIHSARLAMNGGAVLPSKMAIMPSAVCKPIPLRRLLHTSRPVLSAAASEKTPYQKQTDAYNKIDRQSIHVLDAPSITTWQEIPKGGPMRGPDVRSEARSSQPIH